MCERGLADWVLRFLESFLSGPENNMGPGWSEPSWGKPLVGFSRGDDPLYRFYREDIGGFYRLPEEFLGRKYGEAFQASEVTVVSWVLPQTEATKRDQRGERFFPSQRWARSRIYGEEVNVKLRKALVAALEARGLRAEAPMLSPIWRRASSPKYGFASSWSERHAAYASGLGTFGLSDGLITPVGKAVRVGSVVVEAEASPTPRAYSKPYEYCLYKTHGLCGACVDRCPIGAITLEGHNKVLCSKYVDMTREYVRRHYGFEGYGCGLCQTGVPCESCIPEAGSLGDE